MAVGGALMAAHFPERLHWGLRVCGPFITWGSRGPAFMAGSAAETPTPLCWRGVEFAPQRSLEAFFMMDRIRIFIIAALFSFGMPFLSMVGSASAATVDTLTTGNTLGVRTNL